MENSLKKQILLAAKNEITEYHIYEQLAKTIKNSENKIILKKIAEDELKHYNFWQKQIQEKITPQKLIIWFYFFISKIFGLTFGLKLMEKGEKLSQISYAELAKTIPEVLEIEKEENEHERELLNLINEEKLKYISSIVLGLNDALVELTGALAGFTLVLKNTQLIALTGLITGLAASFSMAASEYLSTRSETRGKNPFKSSIYTGLAYLITVIFLILPYLIFKNIYLDLGLTLGVALLVILLFNFYISIAQDISFKKRFMEMASISLGISALTFLISFLIKKLWGGRNLNSFDGGFH